MMRKLKFIPKANSEMNYPPDPPRQLDHLDQLDQLDRPLFDPSPHPMRSHYPLPSSLCPSGYINAMMMNPTNPPTQFDQPLPNPPVAGMISQYLQPLPHYPSTYSNWAMTDSAYLPTQFHQPFSEYPTPGMTSQYLPLSSYNPPRHPNTTMSDSAGPITRFDQPVSEYPSSGMGSQYLPLSPYNTSRYSIAAMNDPAGAYAYPNQLDQRMQPQFSPPSSLHPSAHLDGLDQRMQSQYPPSSSLPSGYPTTMMTSPRTRPSILWAPPIQSSSHLPSSSAASTPTGRSGNAGLMVNSSSTQRAHNRSTGRMAASSGIQRRGRSNRNRIGIGPNGETRPPPLGLRRILRHELRVLQQFHSQVEPENEPLATDTAVENWYWSWAINDVNPARNAAWEAFLRSHSTASEIDLREQALVDYADLKNTQPDKEKAWKSLSRKKLITYI